MFVNTMFVNTANTMKLLPLVAVLLTASSPRASAQTATAVQKPPRLVLVELFTSEGCSSCPPADDVLRRLHNSRVDSRVDANTQGLQIVGLSEHVTYWNRLGWADRFSTSTFTDRQSDYAERFHLSSVYTPQMIVNGEREVLGSDGDAVLKAVRQVAPASSLTIRILSTKIADKKLEVAWQIVGSQPGHMPDIFAALTDDSATTQVRHGENAGHSLTHVSIARSLVQLDVQHDAAAPAAPNTAHLLLPFDETGASSPARHLILFAQEPHSGRVLAVESRAF